MIYATDLLKGKKFLVTGATGGAGRATARLLASCGAQLTLVGRDPERSAKLRHELPGGPHQSAYVCFVRDANLAAGWFKEFGPGFQGVFHAAGEELIAPASMGTTKAAETAMGSTFYATVGLLAAVGARQSILVDGGSVVIMSSVAAVRGTAGMTLYSGAKGAIEAMVRSAAIEFAPRRVRVNAIRAGAFDSKMHGRIVSRLTSSGQLEYEARHPLGIGKDEDIANAATFLLSPAGRWVTGTCMVIDGGYSCR